MREDVVLERFELVRGLDPQLLGHRPTQCLVGIERVSLAPGTVEREHVLPPQPLAKRVAGDERLELTDELAA